MKNLLFSVFAAHGYEVGNLPFKAKVSTWQEPAWAPVSVFLSRLLPVLSLLAAVMAPIQLARLLKNIHEEKSARRQTIILIACLVIWQLQFCFFCIR